jgi:hypothetical protein
VFARTDGDISFNNDPSNPLLIPRRSALAFCSTPLPMTWSFMNGKTGIEKR